MCVYNALVLVSTYIIPLNVSRNQYLNASTNQLIRTPRNWEWGSFLFLSALAGVVNK